jgi:arylsulfatase A-like enzyme
VRFLLAFIYILFGGVFANAAAPKRPNIVFLFSDDHASHAISAYGSKINQTPNIDRIAKEGMLFRNTFCTNSICGPSRAVILTGKHSHINGFYDNRSTFDGSQQTFAKLLQANGYNTAMIGKWHLVTDPTGFDKWTILPGQGIYYNPNFKSDKGPLKVEGYCTDIITDMTINWLDKERDKEKPFLLMCQHKAPHREWAPGPNQLGLYRDKDIPEPDSLFDDWKGLAPGAKYQEMTIAKHMLPSDLKFKSPQSMNPAQKALWDKYYGPENEAYEKNKPTGKDQVRWNYQRYIKDYLRCVAGVDDGVGRVLKYLDENGLAENTIVVYSSDQGFYLGDKGWFDKRWMYDVSMRMPFVVRWPGKIKAGTENHDLVQNLDFGPTFLDAAGIQVPADMQGKSIIPLLEGHTPADWRKSVYYHYYEYPAEHMVPRHYGVRTATHKLIHYYQRDEWELFDLVKDPGETNSVFQNEEYAKVRDELARELIRLRKHYKVEGAPEPEKKAAPRPGAGKKKAG